MTQRFSELPCIFVLLYFGLVIDFEIVSVRSPYSFSVAESRKNFSEFLMQIVEVSYKTMHVLDVCFNRGIAIDCIDIS